MYGDACTGRSKRRLMNGSGWVRMGAGGHTGMREHKHGTKEAYDRTGTYMMAGQ